MEMHQVRYFLAVARVLNFTKAAEECNVAQPSLTRAIQKLEEELGGPLFHRERANTHLTELGRAMQPHLARTYEAAQAAKQLATGFKKGEIARLRLGVSNSVASSTLSEVLTGVRGGVPNLELTMLSGADGSIVDEALEGDLDLVVIGRGGELPERVHSWQLFRENIRLVMPSTHRLAKGADVKLADLAGEAMIERVDCAPCAQLKALAEQAGIDLHWRHAAASEEQIQNLVLTGFGLALAPSSVALAKGLTSRPIDGASINRVVTLCSVAGRRFSPASDAFVKIARTRDWSAAEEA